MKGFTLIEMLVALAALSILAAGGFAIAGVSTSSHDAIRAKQAETQALLRLNAAMRADLSQAAGRRARDLNGEKQQSALSTGDRRQGVFLLLVRRGWENPTQQGRASLQYVEYRLLDGKIERVWRRHVDGSPAQAPQVLMSGVEGVSLEFYDWDQWNTNWSGAPNHPLPRAARVRFDMGARGDITQTFLLAKGAQ